MKESKSKTAIFVKKLRRILNDPEAEDSISWCPQEDAFQITNIHILTQSMLPKYFKHKNLSSFIRQLNIYGFSKVRDPSMFKFSHPHFLQADEALQKEVKRENIPKEGEKDKKRIPTSLFEFEKLKEHQKKLKKSCRELLQNNKLVQEKINNLHLQLKTMRNMKQKLVREKQKQVEKESSHNSTLLDYNSEEIPIEKNYHGGFSFVRNSNRQLNREQSYLRLLIAGSEARKNSTSFLQQVYAQQYPLLKIESI